MSGYSTITDEQLLQSYVKGDYGAFEALYQRYKGSTFRFILRQVESRDTAEDMQQDLWCKVVTSARGFRKESKFNTWLFQMARHILIDKHRHLTVVKQVIELRAEETEGEFKDNSADALLVERQKKALLTCLKKLPKAQLESVLLKEETLMTQADIANVTGVGLEAAKSRLRAGYQNLRACLSDQLGGRND